jgi:uncharacterized membrane protein
MGLPVSLLLIALGAILVWGVTADAEGINVDAVGWILIVVGIVGLVLSFLFWERLGWGAMRRRAMYVEGEPVVRRRVVEPRRRAVVEEEVEDYPGGGPPPP